VHWRGLASHQLPADLIRLQEEIVARRPATIIEVGAGEGGTTVFLADVCQLALQGQVIAVERIDHGAKRAAATFHPRITWHCGESLELAGKLHTNGPTMVILDSDVYNEQHCLEELRAYAPLVTSGQLLVACHVDRKDWGMWPALGRFRDECDTFRSLPHISPTLHAWLVRQ